MLKRSCSLVVTIDLAMKFLVALVAGAAAGRCCLDTTRWESLPHSTQQNYISIQSYSVKPFDGNPTGKEGFKISTQCLQNIGELPVAGQGWPTHRSESSETKQVQWQSPYLWIWKDLSSYLGQNQSGEPSSARGSL